MNAQKRPTARRWGGRWGVIGLAVALAAGITGPTALAGQRVPADSPTTAAGFCDRESGQVATVALHLYIGASPRCLDAKRGQRLRIVNDAPAMIVRWAGHRVWLAHGQSVTFARPMGSYLAPGDHLIIGQRHCRAEVMAPGRVVSASVSAG